MGLQLDEAVMDQAAGYELLRPSSTDVPLPCLRQLLRLWYVGTSVSNAYSCVENQHQQPMHEHA